MKEVMRSGSEAKERPSFIALRGRGGGGFPYKLEFCSRNPGGFELGSGQDVIPIGVDHDHHSLSAILLDDTYYNLIKEQHDETDGLWVANVASLIPLKAYAWLRLTRAKASGKAVDSRDIAKHRSDVFRLAATLPGEPGPGLALPVTEDLKVFLRSFPSDSPEWPAILDSLKTTFAGGLRAEDLRQAIRIFFRLGQVEGG